MTADFQCPRCGRFVPAGEAQSLSWHWYVGALVLGLGAPVPESTCRACARQFRNAGVIVLCIVAAFGLFVWAL
jgi:hypothetical protein